MIRALLQDALRQLLRGRPLLLLVLIGGLCGLFVHATRASGSDHLHGVELRGAALDTWLSAGFLVLLVHAVVAALTLANEDRSTGLLVHVAVRPVRRLVYAWGRLGGLCAALAVSLLLVVLASAPLTGIGRDDVPELRWRVAPAALLVNGKALGEDEIAQLGQGDVASFWFDAAARPEATLDLRPKLIPGQPWSGVVEIAVHYARPGHVRRTWRPDPIRPTHAVPIHFDDEGGGPFALEIEVLGDGCVVEVARELMRGIGARSPLPVQASIAVLLVLLGAAVMASIALLLGTGLSLGPAALAASFALLVGLGRDTVLDIIAGIGIDPALGAEQTLSLGARWTRGFLTVLVHAIPDLAHFNPAEALGGGEAIPLVRVLFALRYALIAGTVALLLTALSVQWRARA